MYLQDLGTENLLPSQLYIRMPALFCPGPVPFHEGESQLHQLEALAHSRQVPGFKRKGPRTSREGICPAIQHFHRVHALLT